MHINVWPISKVFVICISLREGTLVNWFTTKKKKNEEIHTQFGFCGSHFAHCNW